MSEQQLELQPKSCANCGKTAKRRLTEHRLPAHEEYQGKEQIFRQQPVQTYQGYLDWHEKMSEEYGLAGDVQTQEAWEIRNHAHPSRSVWTWDGHSWSSLSYGNFCTLRCALEFANEVVETKGLRRNLGSKN